MPYARGPWPQAPLIQPDINSPDVLRRFAAAVTDDGVFVFDTAAERDLAEAWSANNAADSAWRVRHGLPAALDARLPGSYSEAEPYGDAAVTRQADGTLTVEADDVIGVSVELLDQFEPGHVHDGLLVLDTAGEYRYRPVRFALDGRVVVCERVR